MSIREFLRKSQFPVLLALGTYPLAACVAAFVAPQLLGVVWLFPLIYAALGILTLLLPAKPRLALGVSGALLLLLPCGLYLQGMVRNVALVIAAMYSALLFWSLQLPAWEPRRELGAGWIGSCFAIDLVGYFIASFEDRLAPAALGIKLTLFAFVFLAMLSLNRGSLNLASGESRGFTASMRRKNLLLTAGMFGVALLIALIPSLFNLVVAIFDWIARLIAWLRDMLASLMPAETTVETTTEVTAAATSGEAWMDVVLEDKNFFRNNETTSAMMTAIVLVVLIPAVVFALYRIGKLLVKGVRRLVELIDRAANAQAEDFVDEITDTREDTARNVRKDEKQSHRFAPALGKMTPAERIRYRYRRLLGKHPEWKAHNTARENLDEEAAKLYERARYSDHPITESDADQFQNETK